MLMYKQACNGIALPVSMAASRSQQNLKPNYHDLFSRGAHQKTTTFEWQYIDRIGTSIQAIQQYSPLGQSMYRALSFRVLDIYK